jgi:DNA-binding NarL/FixJ family response regulator
VTGALRVLVADDHPLWRRSIRRAIEGDGFTVCGEAGDAGSAVAKALELAPDVCLLDVNMPGSGITAVRRIAEELPETAVVMLTVSSEDTDLFAALRAGAAGYLLKNMEPKLLPGAVRGVLEGDAPLAPGLVLRLVDEFRDRPRRRRSLLGRGGAQLTGREWEVLELLRQGLTTAEIAERLEISRVTVRRHVSSTVQKLEVSDRDAAVGLLEGRSTH